MAKAVYEGALSSGATVVLKKAPEATSNDLLDCDAAVFCTPNYFSYMAGTMKDFFDRSLYAVRGKVDNKPYAAVSSHGGGGEGGKQGAADALGPAGLCGVHRRTLQRPARAGHFGRAPRAFDRLAPP